MSHQTTIGGKGLNQSIALSRAGVNVYHAGKIGKDGQPLLEKLKEENVDVSLISVGSYPTGHAIIQVTRSGENSIIVEGGANRTLDEADIDRLVNSLHDEDWLLLQNETNCIDKIFERIIDHSCTVEFNPAPMTAEIERLPLDRVDILVVNEIEGAELSKKSEPTAILDSLVEKYPKSKIVLTMGKRGALYADRSKRVYQDGYQVKANDTTAAGDTFVGFFVATHSRGYPVEESLQIACRASSICVTRKGAAVSIPSFDEVAVT